MTYVYRTRSLNALKKKPLRICQKTTIISNKILTEIIEENINPLDYELNEFLPNTKNIREFFNNYDALLNIMSFTFLRENLYKNATVEQKVYMKMAWGI